MILKTCMAAFAALMLVNLFSIDLTLGNVIELGIEKAFITSIVGVILFLSSKARRENEV